MMRHTLMIGLVLATSACYGTCSSSDTPTATATTAGFSSIPARHYGLGRAATPAEVAALNIDVGPDGEGLPAGSGTAALGADIYQKKCAMCHGPKGLGMPPAFPLLISRDPKAEGFKFASDPKLPKSIGNYWPDATTVFDYVRRAMPLLQPGSLTNDEVYSLTAYLLAANEVIPMSATLDSASLTQVKMPYRDKFVVDDRRGGKEVK
jgi:cytochrome c